jgi:uncharacterized protein YjbI with pentapeptide repeats
MPPDQVIQELLEIIERQNVLLERLAVSSQPDLLYDLRLILFGLITGIITAMGSGYFSHRLEMRREQEERRLEEWRRLNDWNRDGRQDDLRGTNLAPSMLWLRLRLRPRPSHRLPWPLLRPRYLDLRSINLGADSEHEGGANLRLCRLSWADLGRANLQEAELVLADLQGTNLWRANLRGANLRRANLWRANLERANLQGTNLVRTDLHEASLERASLQGASLWGTDLRTANLKGAYLHAARFRRTDLRGCDLRGADLNRVQDLEGSRLEGAKANTETQWPEGFQVPDTVVMVGE